MHLASGCGVYWRMDFTPSTSERFRTVLRGLLAVLGAWGLDGVIAMHLYNRVGRIAGRIERMLLRFQAGRLWRMTQRAPTKAEGPLVRRKPAVILPRRFGWLVLAGKHHAASIGLQLQTVLSAPDMTELLAASPAAVRLLRPLCRALAVELPWTQTPPKPRAERTRHPRKPRPKPEPFKIPLPRGALTWARREGFGKPC